MSIARCKRYGIVERANGSLTLVVAALVYMFYPREAERRLLHALQLRKAARIMLYSEKS